MITKQAVMITKRLNKIHFVLPITYFIFSSCGMENSWDQIIYPGMKKCLIGKNNIQIQYVSNCLKLADL